MPKKKKRQRGKAKTSKQSPNREPHSIKQALELANQHYNAGRFAETEAICRKILETSPDNFFANYLLGVVAYRTGHHKMAMDLISRSLEHAPDFAEAHTALGVLQRVAGRLEEAEGSYRRALELKPESADAHNNLGNVLRDSKRLEEAERNFRRALELKPDYADAHSNLGNALRDTGRLQEAEQSHRRALELKPDFAEAHSNLGNVLRDAGRLQEAEQSHCRALELKPDYAEALSGLGNVLKDAGRRDEAEQSYRQSLESKPDYADAHSNLGGVLTDAGRLDDAVASYHEALALKPDFDVAHSNLLLCEQYRVGVTAATLHKLHAEWDERHGKPLREFWPAHDNPKDPDKRLRIGFVSPDLGRHPVGYFLINLLENRMRDEVEFICYSDRQLDDLTERLKAASDEWRDTQGMSHEDLAGVIRADRIDILFDLAGHSGRTRLIMIARKPAPIQVTWAGYVGTTGVKAVDYLLSDVHSTPINEDHNYQEKIIRMPDGWLCYDPPSYAPSVGPLPSEHNGFVTFGSFNYPAKINAEVMAVWVKILEAVPNSRLVLKFRASDSDANRERLLPFFTTRGLDPSRLVLEGWSPHPDLLARYNDIDIVLDPFPYSGGLTTCEALWMGVPVITLPGKSFAGRHSLSHLSSLGLFEFVAANTSNYIEIALALANDASRLASLRAGLRERMAQSPLCDGPRFARHFTSAMREIWREWCLR